MTLTRKDGLATVLTALAVLAFVATHQAWDVWLIGSSHRWAAVSLTLLGSATCALGSASQELSEGIRPGSAVMALAGVGAVAGVLAIVAIATGSLTSVGATGETTNTLRVGEPYYRDAGVEHDVRNANSFEFAFIEIELKDPGQTC